MTILSYTEQLEEVQTAISNILGGVQSAASTGGRKYEYADLDALQKRETYLRSMVSRESNGGITVTQITPTDT